MLSRVYTVIFALCLIVLTFSTLLAQTAPVKCSDKCNMRRLFIQMPEKNDACYKMSQADCITCVTMGGLSNLCVEDPTYSTLTCTPDKAKTKVDWIPIPGCKALCPTAPDWSEASGGEEMGKYTFRGYLYECK